MAQVFSCEFCKIFKNTFFYRTRLVKFPAASINSLAKRRVKGFSSNLEDFGKASYRKIVICDPSSSSDSDIWSDKQKSFDAPQYWIVGINNIVNALQNVYVCIKRHNNLELVDLVNFRAGFGTKFLMSQS